MKDKRAEDLLSVIIPAYNVENYIKECVDSLLVQSYRPIEIIVVNDGSSDNTEEILNEYAANGQVRVFTVSNGGTAKARNLGVSKASGEYLAFVDGDDKVSENVYTSTIQRMEQERASVGCFPLLFGWTAQEHLYSYREQKVLEMKEQFKLMLQDDLSFSICDKVFRRSLFADCGLSFREDKIHEDMFFWQDYFQLSNQRMIFSNEGCYYYRSNPTSKMNQSISIRKAEDYIDAYLSIWDLTHSYSSTFFDRLRYLNWLFVNMDRWLDANSSQLPSAVISFLRKRFQTVVKPSSFAVWFGYCFKQVKTCERKSFFRWKDIVWKINY